MSPVFVCCWSSKNHGKNRWPGIVWRCWSRCCSRRARLHRSLSGPRRRRPVFDSAGIVAPLRDEGDEVGAGHVAALATAVDLQAAAPRGPEGMATPTRSGCGFVQPIEGIGDDCPRNAKPWAGGRGGTLRTLHRGISGGWPAVRCWMAAQENPHGAQTFGITARTGAGQNHGISREIPWPEKSAQERRSAESARGAGAEDRGEDLLRGGPIYCAACPTWDGGASVPRWPRTLRPRHRGSARRVPRIGRRDSAVSAGLRWSCGW